MFDDNDWFRFLLRLFLTILVIALIFVLGLVVGGAFLLSEFAR